MEIKQSKLDAFMYGIACVCTFGLAAMQRIIISEAIRKSHN